MLEIVVPAMNGSTCRDSESSAEKVSGGSTDSMVAQISAGVQRNVTSLASVGEANLTFLPYLVNGTVFW